MKRAVVEQYIDIEAQVAEEEEEEEEDFNEDPMSNFITNRVDQEEEEEEDEEHARSVFEPHGGPEAMAQLQQIAERYDARAAKERRAVESRTDQEGGGVESTLPIIALNVAGAEQSSALWSFRVPPYRAKYFVDHIEDLRKSERFLGWFEEVFTLDHLPGRVFVLGPAETISQLRRKRGIPSEPVQIPRTEWCLGVQSSLFLPWASRDIPPRSWVRISKRGLPYYGSLAYVVGTSRETDRMVVAIVPRIHQTPRVNKMEGTGKGERKINTSGKRKAKAPVLPPILFNAEAMVKRFGQNMVDALPIQEQGFLIFADKFAERVVTYNSDTNERVVREVPLDLTGFDWSDMPTSEENIYQFDGQLFYRGLLILPIFAYGAVEKVAVPPVNELIPFAESHIDSVRINRLLSQLHWQRGDRLSRPDGLYLLKDIQLDSGYVSVVNVENIPKPTEGMSQGEPLVELVPVCEFRTKFFGGDGVVIVAGLHKGVTGTVLREADGLLYILTGKDGHYVSVPCEWAASYLAPTEATLELAAFISLGDVVRVVQGPERSRQGQVVDKLAHSVLSLRDVLTRQIFQVDTQFVEKVAFIQDPVQAYQQPIIPWDTKGRVHEGDFVLVTEGEFAGREGFVKSFTKDSNLVIEETKADPDQPLVIVEGHSDIEAEAATFTVLPLATFLYDRIQLYDTVQLVKGPMKGKTGHVVNIRPNGYLSIKEAIDTMLDIGMKEKVLFLNKYLNVYRSALVIHDRMCIGDSVQVKHGPIESRRGIVKEIHYQGPFQGLVSIEQEFGRVASNAVCLVHIQTLEKIGPTYARAVKHKAIGKQVLITKGSLKGIIGYVVAHNYVLNEFLVDLVSRSKIRLHADHLVYLDDGESLNAGPQVITPQPASPPRQRTPIPDGPLVPPDDPDHEAWNICPGDVTRADDDWRMGSPELTLPQSFLTDPVWKGIHKKHIRVALGPKFGGGNRMGYTKIPLQFDHPFRPSKVALYWTDNKAKWQQGDVPLEDITPSRPTKSKVFVMVLNGDWKGQICMVNKVTKADGTILLATASKPRKELVVNVCIVEDHVETGCSCSRLP